MTNIEWNKFKIAIKRLNGICKDNSKVVYFEEWRDPETRYLMPPKTYKICGIEVTNGKEDLSIEWIKVVGIDGEYVPNRKDIISDEASYDEAIDFLINQFKVYELVETVNPIVQFKEMK